MCAYHNHASSPRKIFKAKFQLPTDFHLQFEWERNHFLFGLLQAVSFSKPHASHYYLATLTNSDKFSSAMLSWRLWKGQTFLFQRKFFCSGKFLNIFRTFFDDGGESDCCHVAALISPSLFVVIIFSQNNGSEC